MKITDFDRIVCITVDTRYPEWPLRVRREIEARGGECSIFLNGSTRVDELGRNRYAQINGDVPEDFQGRPGAYHLCRAFQEVVRRADDHGIEKLLIVEDDLFFTNDYEKITSSITVPEDWGMFYFGANHNFHETEEVPGQPHLLRLHGSYTTHCVGIHRRAFPAILALEPTKPIDVLLGSVHEAMPCYAAWPSVALQRPGVSSIEVGQSADYTGWFKLKGKNWPVAPVQEPNLLTKAGSFLKAATTQVMAGNPRAGEELQAEREAICRACPLLIQEQDRCSLCGCGGMKMKRSWLTSRCPNNLW